MEIEYNSNLPPIPCWLMINMLSIIGIFWYHKSHRAEVSEAGAAAESASNPDVTILTSTRR